MSYVCSTLLINNVPEEESFWMLIGIMDIFQLNYSTTMSGLLASNETFKELLKLVNPTIYNHMEKLQSVTMIFISRWFLTLFTDLKQWQTVLRLWDVIFFEGKSSLFRISLAIMTCCEKQIMECTQFGELGSFLINIPKEIIQVKFLLPTLFSIDNDGLLKKVNANEVKITTNEDKPPETTLLSQMSLFWREFNQTPPKFANKQTDKTLFSFLSNKLGQLNAQETRYTPERKRLLGTSNNQNPLKRSKTFKFITFL